MYQRLYHRAGGIVEKKKKIKTSSSILEIRKQKCNEVSHFCGNIHNMSPESVVSVLSDTPPDVLNVPQATVCWHSDRLSRTQQPQPCQINTIASMHTPCLSRHNAATKCMSEGMHFSCSNEGSTADRFAKRFQRGKLNDFSLTWCHGASSQR